MRMLFCGLKIFREIFALCKEKWIYMKANFLKKAGRELKKDGIPEREA